MFNTRWHHLLKVCTYFGYQRAFTENKTPTRRKQTYYVHLLNCKSVSYSCPLFFLKMGLLISLSKINEDKQKYKYSLENEYEVEF